MVASKVSTMQIVSLVCLSVVAASDYDPIVLPAVAGRAGASKLALFVPGGKVPPADYVPFLSRAMSYSSTKIVGVIVHCGKLNLCDPLGELDGLIAKAIKAAGTASNVTFSPADIFVMGHSLGGVGARHYADTFEKSGAAAFAGLALFGTQFNGDHEDFKGTLGYPLDLKAFGSPLLVLLGELDMQPVSHAALVYTQYANKLNDKERAAKPVVIIPQMDHSQFCSPFNVSGDLVPEISNDLAVHYTGEVTAAWIDTLSSPSPSVVAAAAGTLASWAGNATAPITAPWRAAHAKEAAAFCSEAQLVVLGSLPAAALSKVHVNVLTVDGSANLEHGHTNYTRLPNGDLQLRAVAYPYYPQDSSWNPLSVFAPKYSSASDISCKLVSSDRVAQQLNITGAFPKATPAVPCKAVNELAAREALAALEKDWPAAAARFARRGRNLTFADDTPTPGNVGPLWVFTESLSFDESKASVASPVLYSSISSHIYPGNLYCKVLSPAKAIEWMQTTGIQGRFK